jgi:hypothetical protein
MLRTFRIQTDASHISQLYSKTKFGKGKTPRMT